MRQEKNTKTIWMNLKIKLLLIAISVLGYAKAQTAVYPLHPSIGDTLSQVEKLDYSLFPEISNQTFDFAFITFEKGNYVLNVHEKDSVNQEVILTQAMVVEAQQNIQKINQYYRLKATLDSSKQQSDVQLEKKAPILFNESMNEEMRKQARMDWRLKEDARRMKEFEQGIRPNELRIEF